MTLLSIVVYLLCFTFLSGCAGSKNSLELQSVLDYETQRAERLKAKQEAAPLPSPSPSISPEPSPSGAKFQPQEMVDLSLPADFVLLEKSELPEGASAGWKVEDADILLHVSTTKLDPEKLGFMTRKDFLAEIEKTGKEYEDFYLKKYKAPAVSEVTDGNEVISLKVSARYLENTVWKADELIFYFYKPSYRINLTLTGSDDNLAPYRKELKERFENFTDKLRKRYSVPIDFQAS